MTLVMYLVVGPGLVLSMAALTLALREGRQRPVRAWPWAVGLTILSVDVAFHVLISTGMALQGSLADAWIIVGSVAIAGVLATAVIRPRIAAWVLAITAVLQPLLLLVFGAVLDTSALDLLAPMLAVYSTRSLIVAALLWWATRVRPSAHETEDVPPALITEVRGLDRPARTGVDA